MMSELRLKCAEHLQCLTADNSFKTVHPVDVIAAVKESI